MLPTPARTPTLWYPENKLHLHRVGFFLNLSGALRADRAQPCCGLLALLLCYLLYCHIDSINFCDELLS